MPDIYMDVDTALAEVPVNVMPLMDSTDFITIEGAVAYNAAGMALRWHFVTSAGAYTVTTVTPTTAGNYDWTDQGDSGVYTIETPASGGASINNDTEGYGWFTGVATGVLPWRGPIIGFRAAALNDALCDGGDNLDVNTVQVGGTTQTARDIGASVLLSSGTGTGQVSLSSGAVLLQATQTGVTIPTVTNLTNAPTAGDLTATMKTSVTTACTASTPTAAAVTGAVGSVTAMVTANVTQVSGDSVAADNAEAFFDGTGYAGTNNVIPAVTTVTTTTNLTNLPAAGATAAELAKVPKSDGTSTWNNTALAAIQSECNDALVAYDPPTNAEIPTAAGIADAVWDEVLSGHLGAGSTGNALNAAGAAGDPWSTALPGAYGAGTAGKIIGDNINAPIGTVDTVVDALATTLGSAGAGLTAVPWNVAWDAEVQSECNDALVAYDPPTNTEMEARTIASASYATATNLATVDTVVDAILADTGTDGVVVDAASKTGYALAAAGSAALTQSYAADGAAPTIAQILYEIRAMLCEKSISGVTLTTRQLDGSTTAATYTLNDATTPTSVTRAT